MPTALTAPRHPGLGRYMLQRCVCWGRSCSGPGKREMFPGAAPTALQHRAVCWGQYLGFGLQNPNGFYCVLVGVWESQGEGRGITKVRGGLSKASVVLILVSYSYSHTLVCPDPGSVSASPLTAHWGRAAQSCWAYLRLYSAGGGFCESFTIKRSVRNVSGMSCLHNVLAGRTEETILIHASVREGGVRPAEPRKMMRSPPEWANKVRNHAVSAATLNITRYPALQLTDCLGCLLWCGGVVELLLTAQTSRK